jgi:transposase
MEGVMPTSIPIPESRVAELSEFRKAKWGVSELKRFLCVWLRVEKGMPTEEIARAVGWHADTVRLIQRGFIASGAQVFRVKGKGGRYRQLMPLDEEGEFLEGFLAKAEGASMLVANEVKAELERKLGRKVSKTTVYRIMKRHEWRKVVPRPRHPKQSKEAAAAFKKGATRKG